METQKHQVIVLAAGKSTRFGSAHKHLAPILTPGGGRRPFLELALEFWKPWASSWVFVLSDPWPYLELLNKLSQPFRIVLQHQPLGIGHALLQAQPLAEEKFIVLLGDCLFRGTFAPFQWSAVAGSAAFTLQELRQSYAVTIGVSGTVSFLEEKPIDAVAADYMGLGAYFLDHCIFDAVRQTAPNAKGEVGITESLQTFISEGLPLFVAPFEGAYLNLTWQSDIDRCIGILKGEQ